MLNDRDVALALTAALDLEARSREHWRGTGTDEAEKDSALIVMRHVTALRRSLETWITLRAMRNALASAVK